ncbi:SigE family RNA polymerase sigma factor [Yinghuangia seranimata]|uniref:SigE family RNA polymerase sigma factor n=1 Tax=Yinghuangia seranimata TaxID=408067 RepID=UPI00248AFFD9|nr:SigE family RNA polymerase sigma factor [Yinghuangia seranimata]MDI2128178.1 SigE family RNA polymerase sigma factor [Yinghuangia seranimata]
MRILGRRKAGPANASHADFAEFVRGRSAALVRTATLLVGDLHTAEDLVQHALERAYRNWDRVRAAESPEAYVRRIVANLANDRWRRLGKAPAVPLADEHTAPEAGYGTVERRDALIRALMELPMGMRTVLVLRYFDEQTDDEIAAALDISTSAVRSQAARGLAKLRARFTVSADAPDDAPDNVVFFPFGEAS